MRIDLQTWNRACTSLGWQGPTSDSLWEHLGGGSIQDLQWEFVYRTIMSVGWTGEHAEVLWRTLAAHTAPVPPAPDTLAKPPETPAEQIVEVVGRSDAPPAPWERNAAELDMLAVEPEKKKRVKKEKKAKAPREKKERQPLDLGDAPKRAGAAAIDGVIVVVLGYITTFIVQFLSTKPTPPSILLGMTKNPDLMQSIQSGLVMTILAGVYFFFTMKREDRPGESLGKQVMGLRVVNPGGGPFDAQLILVRQALGVVLIPWFLMWAFNVYLMPGVGFIVLVVLLLLSLRGMGIQDRLAKTEVQEV